MPTDLNAATESFQLVEGHSYGVRFLKIGPLVKAKFQSYGRGKPGDYTDLVFVCTHPKYRQDVKEVADEIRRDKRELFLQEVHQTDPAAGTCIRDALRLGGNIDTEENEENEDLEAEAASQF